MEREHIASIHIKPCKIAQSEMHNRRDMEYLNSLDPAKLYIRTDLMHLNETYVAPDMEGVSLQELYDSIKAMVKEKTGRAMQEKDVEYIGKNGKKKVRQGCSPIRESVVNIKSDTTMDDLLRYSERVHEKWGIKVVQIHMHKDEGHYENVQDPATWKPNLHAHIIWDWMNHSTGKSYKLNADDMSEMQDMAAETLAMERGKKKSETGADHLERNDYILQKQREEQERLQKEAEEAQAKKKAAEKQAAEAEKQKAQLDESIAQKRRERLKISTSIQTNTEQKLKLDCEIQDRKNQSKSLNTQINTKKEQISGLDADIATKKETIGSLDADIQTKNEKLRSLDEQMDNLLLAQQNIQNGEVWKENVFRALTALVYCGNEKMQACISAIQDYACSGRGKGKQYRSIFSGEEASGIKAFMDYFYSITKIAAVQTGSLLVWMANEMCKVGKFSDWEKRNVAHEVNDVAIGRYDGLIRKFMNKGGGRKW